jgi:hypothetical protein
MAHPHKKLVALLLGRRHGENGNNTRQHSASFYCGKHIIQLLLNTTTYYYTRKFLQTTHKIWLRIQELYIPHTTYIKLLRDNEKRKHGIEAKCKHMEKQRKKIKIRSIPALNKLRSYSINY